jgi:hypothetical protein
VNGEEGGMRGTIERFSILAPCAIRKSLKVL